MKRDFNLGKESIWTPHNEGHLAVVCPLTSQRYRSPSLVREASSRGLQKCGRHGGGAGLWRQARVGFSIPVSGSQTTETGICSGLGTLSPTQDPWGLVQCVGATSHAGRGPFGV